MPWRLIAVILVFAVLLTFITFNLENKCDINFGFTQIEEVPIFMTIFLSFVLGLFCTFPLLLRSMKSNKEKPNIDKPPKEKQPLIIESKYFKKKEKNPDSGPYEKI